MNLTKVRSVSLTDLENLSICENTEVISPPYNLIYVTPEKTKREKKKKQFQMNRKYLQITDLILRDVFFYWF